MQLSAVCLCCEVCHALYLSRDDIRTEIIDFMLDNDLFLPNGEDLDKIKEWIVFNIKDILSYHCEELYTFRKAFRFSFNCKQKHLCHYMHTIENK